MDARLTKIDSSEVMRYLGVRGAPDPELLARVEARSAELMAAAKPRLVWRRLPMTQENDYLIAGQDLRNLLRGCREIVLFAATLGSEAELLIRRAQARDMAEALILDACAGSAIENVCDNFCADLAALAAPDYLTDRYSPGYGDLPLEHQKVLFSALNITRRIGVTLTESGLMLPQKSVTAILGISPTPRGRRSGCTHCPMNETCAYRKEGTTCEVQ